MDENNEKKSEKKSENGLLFPMACHSGEGAALNGGGIRMVPAVDFASALGVFLRAQQQVGQAILNWTPEQFLAACQTHSLWGCYYGQEIVSLVLVMDLGQFEGEILILVTEPEKQGAGCARQLMEFLFSGFEKLFLEVHAQNTKALNCYRALGFVQVGLRRSYYRDFGDALVMCWANSKK